MLIYDLADPVELQGFARGLQDELENNTFVLRQFLPNDNIDDIEYRVNRGSLNDADAAKVRTWDAESPIGKRQGFERIMGELPPISKKIPLGEEARLRRRSLERNGDVREIVNAIFDDAGQMVRAVVARLELMRGEALYRGRIDINENGVNQPIDFGRDASHEVTLAGGAMWSAPATATPITDMQAWVQTYIDTNGVPPALALTSNAVINNLLLNDQVRTFAAANGITPAVLTPQALRQVFAAYNLPPFVAYDVTVRVDGVATRVIPSDRVILLPPAGEPLGATLLGTTVESLELVGARQLAADQAPGLTVVVEKTFDPVITWTKAVAIGLPVLVNPDLTFAADVQ